MNYRDAGVDIDAGNALVERIKPYAQATHRPEVMAGLGGFGALFDLSRTKYKEPVLVSGADGVGTKLKLAQRLGRHDSIGVDLVAMCVNDVLCQGAEPLYFMDYFACGRLDIDVAAEVVRGIAEGCRQAGCALAGGETAEMPGMYQAGEYDLAGFCVGLVEKSKILDGARVEAGDALLGIASSGPHSNGYSLIRKILDSTNADLEQPIGDATLADALMCPTRIYVKAVLDLLQRFSIAAIAHITGGGLLENIIRVVPSDFGVQLNRSAWREPEIFNWLKNAGRLNERDMLRTFNCGIGLVLVLPGAERSEAISAISEYGFDAWPIGEVVQAQQDAPRVNVG